MIVITLNNKEVNWILRPSKYPIKEHSKSNFQRSISIELRELYPLRIILEEVTIPETRLKLDFLIPSLKIAIECQGKQHTEFIPYFHKTIMGFVNQQRRDSLKQKFCMQNNITFVEIFENDKRKRDIKDIIRSEIRRA